MDNRNVKTVLSGYGIQLLGLLLGPLLGFLSVFLIPIGYSVLLAAVIVVSFLLGGHRYAAAVEKRKLYRNENHMALFGELEKGAE